MKARKFAPNSRKSTSFSGKFQIVSGLMEGQVLQRIGPKGATAFLIGICPENGPISAQVSDSKNRILVEIEVVGSAADGKFEATLPDIPAGGPYCLMLRCRGERVRVDAFFVGDVWLLAGQSNMQGLGDMEGKAKTDPCVRAFSLRRVWRLAEDPLHITAESPDICHHLGKQCTEGKAEQLRCTAKQGTGVGVFFGREMLRRTKVPQGIICAAQGGTRMDLWEPALKKKERDSLYASMLASVRATGQPIAGVLWYQGESDSHRELAGKYTKRMIKLVKATRRDLGQLNLPWVVVQIAKVYTTRRDAAWWNSIQEQQRRLPEVIPELEVVASIDLPHDDPGHVGSRGLSRLGNRLAETAELMIAPKGKRNGPPRLYRIRTTRSPGATFDDRLEIIYRGVKGGLHSAGEPHGFSLTGVYGEKLSVIYQTTLKSDRAILHLGERLPEGTLLHYGRGISAYCNIVDGHDFALPVFGPFELSKPVAWLPFISTWNVAPLFISETPLKDFGAKDFEKHTFETRTYDYGFANEYVRWHRNPGIGLFAASIELSEPMQLKFLMGYDGPFRLWVDGEPFFADLDGTNPCVPDKSQKRLTLCKGTHRLQVAMNTNDGCAWGFYLRFIRMDVHASSIRENRFTRPRYLS